MLHGGFNVVCGMDRVCVLEDCGGVHVLVPFLVIGSGGPRVAVFFRKGFVGGTEIRTDFNGEETFCIETEHVADPGVTT